MATHTNLASLFTDIADAIREKTGGTEEIVADNFPAEIAAIEAGGVSFPNGTKWTQGDIASEAVGRVYHANGVWVASTYDSGLHYSTDGKTWTQSNVTSGQGAQVVYENGVWFAYDGSTSNFYSTDGKVWAKSNLDRGVNDICCANGMWVAVSGRIYYSTDGKTWTQSNAPGGAYNCVCYGNGLWVVDGGKCYSTDGKTWTQNTASVNVTRLCYANGLFVGYSLTNGALLYYSVDGKTWTQSNIPAGFIYDVQNSNGMWVAVSSNGLYYSADGKSWMLGVSGESYAVRNGNGMWVADCYDGSFYSTDGKTWTLGGEIYATPYYANGIWVAYGYYGLYYSADGKSWTQSNVCGDSLLCGCACYADGIWVATSGDMYTYGIADSIYYSVAWEM